MKKRIVMAALAATMLLRIFVIRMLASMPTQPRLVLR